MSATLHCIASGSSGNSYVLTAGNDRLVLEAGVNIKVLLEVLGYNVDNVNVLATHRHLDHAKYIPKYQHYFTVYGSSDLNERYGDIRALEPKKRYRIGNFEVMPLSVEHGVPNFAYVIDHAEIGRLVFVTDCKAFPYVLKDCTHLLIECNFVEEVVIRNMLNNEDVRSQVDMHMELSETVEAVKRLQNPLLRNVILCHLSSSNADREIITERFEQELGITPQFATAGKEFDVSQFEF